MSVDNNKKKITIGPNSFLKTLKSVKIGTCRGVELVGDIRLTPPSPI